MLTKKLQSEGSLVAKVKSSHRQIYGCHHDLVNRYVIPVLEMTTNMFRLLWSVSHFSFLTVILNESSMTDATSGT